MRIDGLMLVTLLLAMAATGAAAQSLELPERPGARPLTTDNVPHIQIGAQPDPALTQALLRHMESINGVVLEETRIGFPGSIGFNLEPDAPVAEPEAIVVGREFAHVHPDGSLHASLSPIAAQHAISQGWAIAHPWADRRAGWEGFVLIYTPTSEDELLNVIAMLEDSFRFVSGTAAD